MRKVMRFVLIALTAGWMAMIFVMSSADALHSAGMSHSFDRTVAKAIHRDFDSWDAERQNEYILKIDHPVRKIAHFTEFAVLGVLLFATCSVWGLGLLRSLLLSLPLGVVYAAVDEIHQSFISGRSRQFTDVMIDSAGVLLGCAVSVLAVLILAGRRRKKQKTGST